MIRTSSPRAFPACSSFFFFPAAALYHFFFFSHHYYAAAGRKQLSEAFEEQYISCRLIQNTFAASHKIHLLNHTKYSYCNIQNTFREQYVSCRLIHNTFAASSIIDIINKSMIKQLQLQLLENIKAKEKTCAHKLCVEMNKYRGKIAEIKRI